MTTKFNFQSTLATTALYIFGSNLLWAVSVSAQDQLPFEFDRRCRTAVDCVFEPPESGGRVYLDCTPDGYCACANFRLIADVSVWNLQWEPTYKQCTIAETGPCGKDNLLDISCGSELQCIKGRCRSPDRIASGRRGDWCNDDIDCEEGLKCSLVSFTFQPVRRCMDRMTTTSVSADPNPTPVPPIMNTTTAAPRSRMQSNNVTTTTTMVTTTTKTQSPGVSIIIEEEEQHPEPEPEPALEQNDTITKTIIFPSTKQIIDLIISNVSDIILTSSTNNTESRSNHIVEDEDLVQTQSMNSSPSNSPSAFFNFFIVSVTIFPLKFLFDFKLNM